MVTLTESLHEAKKVPLITPFHAQWVKNTLPNLLLPTDKLMIAHLFLLFS